jgi:O-antigen/teichoic acid export membrane protein
MSLVHAHLRSTPQTPNRQIRVWHGAALRTVLAIGARIASFAATVMILRSFDGRSAGTFFISMTAGSLFAFVATAGVPETLMRVVPAADARSEVGVALGALRSAIRICTTICLGLACIWLAAGVLTRGAESIGAIVILGSALAWQSVSAASLRSRAHLAEAEVVTGLVPFVFVVGLVLLTDAGGSGRQLIWLRASLEVVVGAIAVILASRAYRGWFAASADVRGILTIAGPLWLTTFAWLVAQQLSILLLGMMRGPAAATAYVPLYRLAELSALPIVAMSAYLLPEASRRWASRDVRGSVALYHEATAVMVGFASCVLAMLIVFPDALMMVAFGSAEGMSLSGLRILAVGFLVNAALGPNGVYLEAIGRPKTLVRRSLAALGISVSFGVIAVASWGVLGGAIATTTSYCVLNAMNSLLLHRIAGIRPRVIPSSIVVTVTLAVGAALWSLGARPSSLGGLGAIGMVVGSTALVTSALVTPPVRRRLLSMTGRMR